MSKLSLAVAAFVFAASPAAFAAQANPEQESEQEVAATKEKQDSEKREADEADKKKICKRIKNMGSRFSQKVCMTRAEWDAEHRGTQDSIRDSKRD